MWLPDFKAVVAPSLVCWRRHVSYCLLLEIDFCFTGGQVPLTAVMQIWKFRKNWQNSKEHSFTPNWYCGPWLRPKTFGVSKVETAWKWLHLLTVFKRQFYGFRSRRSVFCQGWQLRKGQVLVFLSPKNRTDLSGKRLSWAAMLNDLMERVFSLF